MKEEDNSTLISNNKSNKLKIETKKDYMKNNSVKKTFVTGLKQNLDSELISQEEYNKVISSFRQYVEITK